MRFCHALLFIQSFAVLCLWLCLFGAFAALAGQDLGAHELFRVSIAHTNDTHSIYGGYTADGRICYAPRCEGGMGGYARLHQAVRAVRSKRPDTLLLDAGDIFQGSLYWTAHKSSMPVTILPFFNYLAFVPGNHEFDEGCEPFFHLVSGLHRQDGTGTVPLAANLSFAPFVSPKEAPQIAPWLITDVRGRKVGVIGLANPETPSLAFPCSQARFGDPVSSLRKAVAALQEQGVDIIVALTHLGLEQDKMLAAQVDGVDVIVGGHSHSLLSNTQPGASGAYPLHLVSPSGEPVLIVTAGSHTRFLGSLDVDFDSKGVARAWQGDVIVLTDSALADSALASPSAPDDDAELARQVESFSIPVRTMFEEKLGTILLADQKGPLEDTKRQCRQKECLTGNIVADALLSAVPDAEIALLNGGAIRNALPTGPVSLGNVLETLPYADACATATLSGRDVQRALEHGLSAYADAAGRFLQVSGLRYDCNPAAPVGKRLLNVWVQKADGQWHTIDPDGKYTVVVLDYLSQGGDGFSFFSHFSWKTGKLQSSDALRDYIIKNSPLQPELQKRIHVRGIDELP